ncbi:MAG: endonuclease/exonuclease/phosphatase family protein [Alphaproteobacteria bacterium]|jgi:endonuclease/exonuclease/phosphatase family metal-dependent hydrolase|nr:endonuclease/exonuclease/phosphatase family protein [Alphaproteobacteria bacterium]MBP9776387.1 endonuclease/exonuclease/phosphatase family protein [Alphaproteobacteria bacterium]
MNLPNSYLNIFSLNIEKDNHFSRIIPFFQQKKPDVILLQEVFLEDIPFLEKELRMKSTFVPMKTLVYKEDQKTLGVATFSALPVKKAYHTYYFGTDENLPIGPEGNPFNTARAILVTEIVKDNKTNRLINTHFTWTPDGTDSDQQHQDLQNLLQLLAEIPSFILCGDFNAPRGKVIFNKIAAKYKDNIPSHIKTTIDKTLHRAGDLQIVVDGLFSTPNYSVKSVEVLEGLSDHCAISAKVFLEEDKE